jgi:hypothetical protein
VSVAEFHRQLQEVTNFPLRPFVLPFLHTNIPLLQRDIARYSAFYCLLWTDILKGISHKIRQSGMKTSGGRIRNGGCVILYFEFRSFYFNWRLNSMVFGLM